MFPGIPVYFYYVSIALQQISKIMEGLHPSERERRANYIWIQKSKEGLKKA
jgi:hypothetical protein